MKIDAVLGSDIDVTATAARHAEAAGYAGAWVGDTNHDPFLQILQAAQATTDITVGTAVAIAFARSPMTTATSAYDLARYAQGRFVLGLGSQVKSHIERRFSMTWSSPAARMREYVLALKAIWASWQDGTKLDFQGEFYSHTLMTPFFAPEPHPAGPPPVYVAGVNVAMTEAAGEVADGFILHPFTTRRYLDEVTLPALRRGRAKQGGTLDDFVINGPMFVAVGRTEEELAAAIAGTRARIAFYGSTPAYRPVLDLHGWGDLQPELTRLTKEGRWGELGSLITDDILHAFAVVGTPAEVGPALYAKVGDVLARTSFYTPYDAEPGLLTDLLAHVRPSAA
ncbi:TIGR03617 family F420-dependent LLM class oxidoreductase [Frankia sp. R82]|uniref:TIGR03617 family F420-dependent LLM class oxidoreductase n=1 Tax=Frankia sp. R82 TaxID=2950553 RepID=UPI002043DEA5|nr:TIGR03617 family F420-dependent LLM class oxidoreductase [Frankia sp. R82]MCM3882098.1 TIGR03617 family F420-dependent LLM class oxidoreductase [Frankia sp. R82]